MLYSSELEACRAWVETFNALPYNVVEKLLNNNDEEMVEVTIPTRGDRVYVFDSHESGEITFTPTGLEDDDMYMIHLDNGDDVTCLLEDFDVEREDFLPMWGTLWAFHDEIDNDWLRNEFETDGLKLMSECGFRIYEQEDYGFIFGIDGAGYDFYEAHWLPLDRARGLKWHSEEAVNTQAYSAEYDEDNMSANVFTKYLGIDLKVRVPNDKMRLLYYSMQDDFDKEDVLTELENAEEGQFTEEETALIEENAEEIASLYREIRDEDSSWHDCLMCAIKVFLSQHMNK